MTTGQTPVPQTDDAAKLAPGIAALLRQPVLFCLAATAFLVPLLATFAPLGLAPLGGVLGAVLLLLAIFGRASLPKPRAPLILLLLAILLWAGLTAFWAIDPSRSLSTIIRLVLIFGSAVLALHAAAGLNGGGQRQVALALTWSFAAVLVFLLVEIAAGAPMSRWLHGADPNTDTLAVYNRSASALSVIAWPALLAAWRYLGRAAAVAVALLTIAVLAQLNSSAPVFGVFLGLLVFAAGTFWRRATALVLAAVIIVLTLAIPALPLITPFIDRTLASANYVDSGVNHRLRIWEYVAGRSHQRPLTGWGLDASRNLADRTERVTIQTTADGLTGEAEAIPLHPHNATLQIWVELGLPGALLAMLLLLWTIRCIHSRIPGKLESAICLATIASATVGAELSFGIWQGWWQATLWLAAALTLAIAAPPQPAA